MESGEPNLGRPRPGRGWFDGDGKLHVVVQSPDWDPGQQENCEILVLEGRDGYPAAHGKGVEFRGFWFAIQHTASSKTAFMTNGSIEFLTTPMNRKS